MTLADRKIDKEEKDILMRVGQVAGLESKQVDLLLDWVVEGYHWMQSGYEKLEM